METKKLNNESVNNSVDNLAAELEALKAQMAKAKEELAKAKLAAKKANGRPIRLWYWLIALDPEGSNMIHKGDVHYCEEEKGIKMVKEGKAEEAYLLKVNKETNEKVLVSKIYINEDGCLTID